MSQVRRIEGTALPLRGADIDTDRIMPARFLRVVTFAGLEEHVFEDDRAQLREAGKVHPFDDPRFAGATVLLVGSNFGCGSSREHAPQGLHRAGIRAIVGESYSEIFFGNSLALGLPCLTASSDDVASLMALVESEPTTRLAVDVEKMRVSHPRGAIDARLPAAAHEALLTGAWDGTGQLLADPEAIRATAARLPYVSGFRSA